MLLWDNISKKLCIHTKKYSLILYLREDILAKCPAESKASKLKVVACLSNIIVNDAISKAIVSYQGADAKVKSSTISPECQKEVKFQLLQKHSNINLNPIVVNILKYC